MSRTARKHLTPKRYAERRPRDERRPGTTGGEHLKTRKQRRAAGKRAWRGELSA